MLLKVMAAGHRVNWCWPLASLVFLSFIPVAGLLLAVVVSLAKGRFALITPVRPSCDATREPVFNYSLADGVRCRQIMAKRAIAIGRCWLRRLLAVLVLGSRSRSPVRPPN